MIKRITTFIYPYILSLWTIGMLFSMSTVQATVPGNNNIAKASFNKLNISDDITEKLNKVIESKRLKQRQLAGESPLGQSQVAILYLLTTAWFLASPEVQKMNYKRMQKMTYSRVLQKMNHRKVLLELKYSKGLRKLKNSRELEEKFLSIKLFDYYFTNVENRPKEIKNLLYALENYIDAKKRDDNAVEIEELDDYLWETSIEDLEESEDENSLKEGIEVSNCRKELMARLFIAKEFLAVELRKIQQKNRTQCNHHTVLDSLLKRICQKGGADAELMTYINEELLKHDRDIEEFKDKVEQKMRTIVKDLLTPAQISKDTRITEIGSVQEAEAKFRTYLHDIIENTLWLKNLIKYEKISIEEVITSDLVALLMQLDKLIRNNRIDIHKRKQLIQNALQNLSNSIILTCIARFSTIRQQLNSSSFDVRKLNKQLGRSICFDAINSFIVDTVPSFIKDKSQMIKQTAENNYECWRKFLNSQTTSYHSFIQSDEWKQWKEWEEWLRKLQHTIQQQKANVLPLLALLLVVLLQYYKELQHLQGYAQLRSVTLFS